MKIRGRFVAAGTALALFAGGCSSASFDKNRETLERPFGAMSDYWERMGALGLGDVTLQTVATGSVSCGNTNITPVDASPATYCNRPEGPDVIYISGPSYQKTEDRAKRNGISAEAVGIATISHEYGHVLQYRRVAAPKGKEEQLADCLAGVAVQATAPELGEQAADFLDRLASGSNYSRKDAFATGFRGGVSACSADMALLLGQHPDFKQPDLMTATA